MLTNSDCLAAAPGTKPYRLSDRDSLFLLIKPSGSKLWQYRYRLAGREQIHSIGAYQLAGETRVRVTLKEARKRLEAARKLVANGIHPGHHARAERAQREAERKSKAAKDADTLATFVAEWLEHVAQKGTPGGRGPWSQARTDRTRAFLTRRLLRTIGHIPVGSLTRGDVQAALDKVEKDHVYTARLLKQWLRLALAWGVKRGRVPPEVLTEVSLTDLAGHRHRHKRPLKPEEIAPLWQALEGYGGEDKGIGLRLLLLTFARPSELREARWSEIDGATWRISPERTKMHTEHIVPLSIEAQALLKRLRRINGDSPFLFPGTIKRDSPTSAQAWHECLEAIGWLDRFTPHAARATASTQLRELGYSSAWIEVQLGHLRRNRSETEASYDFAEYLPQRRKMMARWSAYVTGLATGAVQALPSREAA